MTNPQAQTRKTWLFVLLLVAFTSVCCLPDKPPVPYNWRKSVFGTKDTIDACFEIYRKWFMIVHLPVFQNGLFTVMSGLARIEDPNDPSVIGFSCFDERGSDVPEYEIQSDGRFYLHCVKPDLPWFGKFQNRAFGYCSPFKMVDPRGKVVDPAETGCVNIQTFSQFQTLLGWVSVPGVVFGAADHPGQVDGRPAGTKVAASMSITDLFSGGSKQVREAHEVVFPIPMSSKIYRVCATAPVGSGQIQVNAVFTNTRVQ